MQYITPRGVCLCAAWCRGGREGERVSSGPRSLFALLHLLHTRTRPCLLPSLSPSSSLLSSSRFPRTRPPRTTMSAIVYRQYMGESDLPYIMALVQHELSEPYVIYTYRYFLHQWYVHALSCLRRRY